MTTMQLQNFPCRNLPIKKNMKVKSYFAFVQVFISYHILTCSLIPKRNCWCNTIVKQLIFLNYLRKPLKNNMIFLSCSINAGFPETIAGVDLMKWHQTFFAWVETSKWLQFFNHNNCFQNNQLNMCNPLLPNRE